jgi:hypothetical protein
LRLWWPTKHACLEQHACRLACLVLRQCLSICLCVPRSWQMLATGRACNRTCPPSVGICGGSAASSTRRRSARWCSSTRSAHTQAARWNGTCLRRKKTRKTPSCQMERHLSKTKKREEHQAARWNGTQNNRSRALHEMPAQKGRVFLDPCIPCARRAPLDRTASIVFWWFFGVFLFWTGQHLLPLCSGSLAALNPIGNGDLDIRAISSRGWRQTQACGRWPGMVLLTLLQRPSYVSHR